MRKKVITWILLLVNLVIIAAIGLLDPHLRELGGVFQKLDLWWVAGGVMMGVLYWVFDAIKCVVSLHLTSKVPNRFFSYLKIAIIGTYYSAITPFATGGQPMQVYYFGKYGVSGGIATAVLVMQYVVLLICHTLIYIVAFIAKSGLILSKAAGIFPFAVLGLVLIVVLLFAVLAMASHNKRLKRILYWGLRCLQRFRIVKRPLHQWRRLHKAVDDFQNGIKMQQGDWKTMVFLFLITLAQLIGFFSIPYFVYRSFGLTQSAWFDMTLVSAFMQVMVAYFPTPGASGASEGAFYVFFPIFFPRPFIFVAMLMWRIMSYYLNIAAGALVVFMEGILHIARDRAPSALEEPTQMHEHI